MADLRDWCWCEEVRRSLERKRCGIWRSFLSFASIAAAELAWVRREQFGGAPRLGRWLARFFTARNARSYARRFAERPASLSRALELGRIPFSSIPSGWIWQLLKACG